MLKGFRRVLQTASTREVRRAFPRPAGQLLPLALENAYLGGGMRASFNFGSKDIH
jgi:hypothetical protein